MGDVKSVSTSFEPRSTLGMEEVGDQAGDQAGVHPKKGDVPNRFLVGSLMYIGGVQRGYCGL